MTFKTLAALLESHAKLHESADDMGGTGLGPKPHPVLSRAELVRFGDKMEQAINKLEEIRSIFKHVPDATGPAHKLGHIGEKGGFDMSHFNGVNALLDKLEEAIEDMHMDWGTQVQSETGAFGDDDEPADADVEAEAEADADDLPAEPNSDPLEQPAKQPAK